MLSLHIQDHTRTCFLRSPALQRHLRPCEPESEGRVRGNNRGGVAAGPGALGPDHPRGRGLLRSPPPLNLGQVTPATWAPASSPAKGGTATYTREPVRINWDNPGKAPGVMANGPWASHAPKPRVGRGVPRQTFRGDRVLTGLVAGPRSGSGARPWAPRRTSGMGTLAPLAWPLGSPWRPPPEHPPRERPTHRLLHGGRHLGTGPRREAGRTAPPRSGPGPLLLPRGPQLPQPTTPSPHSLPLDLRLTIPDV